MIEEFAKQADELSEKITAIYADNGDPSEYESALLKILDQARELGIYYEVRSAFIDIGIKRSQAKRNQNEQRTNIPD